MNHIGKLPYIAIHPLCDQYHCVNKMRGELISNQCADADSFVVDETSCPTLDHPTFELIAAILCNDTSSIMNAYLNRDFPHSRAGSL
jgi:hypothetical protein